MAGNSLILNDALPAQADVLATLWSPESVAPYLVESHVMGVSLAESGNNRAAAKATTAPVTTLLFTAGTGGTNGTFALAFSGGGGTGAAGTFTVAGGVITAVTLTSGGSGYTSAPTVSVAASSGLTGTVTAKIGLATQSGTPTYNAKSVTVTVPAQIDFGIVPSEADQVWVTVMKKQTGTAQPMIYAAPTGAIFGFLNSSGNIGFHNSVAGASPNIPYIAMPSATDYNFVAAIGRLSTPGVIVAGSGGTLGSTTTGVTNGGVRPTSSNGQTIRIGAGSGSQTVDVAYFARMAIPTGMTDAQVLAALQDWYTHLRDGGALGVTIA